MPLAPVALTGFEADPAAALGRAREGLLSGDDRRARGAVYTPTAIADGVVGEAVFGADLGRAPSVCDPAVGAGAFLLASARLLAGRGPTPARVVSELLHGSDVDPLAVATTEAALMLWAWTAGGAAARPADGRLVVGDPLLSGAGLWAGSSPAAGFDLVVGNPPFQGQLSGPSVRGPERAAELRDRWGDVTSGYVDSAALFLLLSTRLVRSGGRVAMIQPESVLGARDAEPARRAIAVEAELVGLWVAGASVFDAAVKVCAPVLQRRPGASSRQRPPLPVRCTFGPGFSLRPGEITPARPGRGNGENRESWSHLLAASFETPAVSIGGVGDATLADLATATAGFRDQFYGLAPFVVEAPPTAPDEWPAAARPALAPLVTTGLIDPARSDWGERVARFAGRRWVRPAVDRPALRHADPRLALWVDNRLCPKVLVATQTRVIEAVADPEGRLVPSVPVLSVEVRCPDQVGHVWLVLAALLSPPASAWALREAAGAALAVDAIKLSARQVLRLPLPSHRTPWHDAAALLARAHERLVAPDWQRFARLSLDAYGLSSDDLVLGWWLERLPGASP